MLNLREQIAHLKLGIKVDFGQHLDNDEVLYEIIKHLAVKKLTILLDKDCSICSYYLDEEVKFIYNNYEYTNGMLLFTESVPREKQNV